MVTLLCVSDKTHSQLMELMPERCGGIQTSTTTTSPINTSGDSASQNPRSLEKESPPSMRDFETILQAVRLKWFFNLIHQIQKIFHNYVLF